MEITFIQPEGKSLRENEAGKMARENEFGAQKIRVYFNQIVVYNIKTGTREILY